MKRAFTLISLNVKKGDYEGKGIIDSLNIVTPQFKGGGLMNVENGGIGKAWSNSPYITFDNKTINAEGWDKSEMMSYATLPIENYPPVGGIKIVRI